MTGTRLRLLRILWTARWWVLLAALAGLATVAANTGLLATAAYAFVAAARRPLLIELTGVLYLVRFFGVSRAFVRYAERLVSHGTTFRLLARLRGWTYRRLAPLSPSQLGAFRGGDLLARLVGDVEELEHGFQEIAAPILVALLTVVLTGFVLDAFAGRLALAALVPLLLAGLGLPLLGARFGRRGRTVIERRAERDALLVEAVHGAADLLASGSEAAWRARLATIDGEIGAARRRLALGGALEQSLGELLAGVAPAAVLLLAIPLVRSGSLDGAYLPALALLALGAFEAVRPLGGAFQRLPGTLAAGERLFQVADLTPAVCDPDQPLALPERAELRFERVSFAYAPGQPPALDDLSLTLRPGQWLAVVGPSGAGKSTLAHLAVRFADPTSGAVLLGGRDLRRLALAELRDRIAVVGQDAHLFGDTLRANLLLARPAASEEELAEAIRLADLEEVVLRLPHGLASWVGERGALLSGGERQRVALARALLKRAPLLVLDEFTANLDPLTERRLLARLRDLPHAPAVLLITHRLIELEQVDEIVVLDGGRVVERGSHAELTARPGLYRSLLEVQNQVLA